MSLVSETSVTCGEKYVPNATAGTTRSASVGAVGKGCGNGSAAGWLLLKKFVPVISTVLLTPPEDCATTLGKWVAAVGGNGSRTRIVVEAGVPVLTHGGLVTFSVLSPS